MTQQNAITGSDLSARRKPLPAPSAKSLRARRVGLKEDRAPLSNHSFLHRAAPGLQAKLVVGEPNDQFEQAADRVADRVMRMPAETHVSTAASPFGASNHAVQRKCACGGTPGPTGECDACRKKRLGLQRRAATSHGPGEAPPIVHEVLRSPGQPLDAATRAFMEPRFGYDFSNVRVHRDSFAAKSAEALNAAAYTVGHHIAFRAGLYSPETAIGRQLLAHELSHTIQQSEGISPVVQRLGDITKVPSGLETECEIAGDPPPFVIEHFLFGNSVTALSGVQTGEIDNFVLNWRAAGANARVRVDGYASTPGGDELNWRLACNRARAVAEHLMNPSAGTSGIPAAFVRTVAQGETGEFGAEASNRRATISSPLLLVPPPTPPSLQTVKVWFNSFIPMNRIPGPPLHDCFTGDNRGFSNAIAASSRTHQEIEFNVATLSKTVDFRDTGFTHEVNCTTGAVLHTGKAPRSELTNGSVVRTTAGIDVDFQTDATNPLVAAAPAINAEVVFHVNPIARTCRLTGEHDGFPAYEAYVTANGGAGTPVYTYDPRTTGEGISALFPPMDEAVPGATVSF